MNSKNLQNSFLTIGDSPNTRLLPRDSELELMDDEEEDEEPMEDIYMEDIKALDESFNENEQSSSGLFESPGYGKERGISSILLTLQSRSLME